MLVVSYNKDPYLPNRLHDYYSGIVGGQGNFIYPSGSVVLAIKKLPPQFEAKLTSVGVYILTHCLGTRDYSIEIAIKDGTYRHEISQINENDFTISIFDAEGSPASIEWKFGIRRNH